MQSLEIEVVVASPEGGDLDSLALELAALVVGVQGAMTMRTAVAEQVVEGNRDQIISLIVHIVHGLQLPSLIDQGEVKTEIARIRSQRRGSRAEARRDCTRGDSSEEIPGGVAGAACEGRVRRKGLAKGTMKVGRVGCEASARKGRQASGESPDQFS